MVTTAWMCYSIWSSFHDLIELERWNWIPAQHNKPSAVFCLILVNILHYILKFEEWEMDGTGSDSHDWKNRQSFIK